MSLRPGQASHAWHASSPHPLQVEPVMKTEYEEVWDWRLENENKPIWTRNPKDVSETAYNDFFKVRRGTGAPKGKQGHAYTGQRRHDCTPAGSIFSWGCSDAVCRSITCTPTCPCPASHVSLSSPCRPQTTFGEFLDPLAHVHFNVEGTIEFSAILYLPGMAPFEQQNAMQVGATPGVTRQEGALALRWLGKGWCLDRRRRI